MRVRTSTEIHMQELCWHLDANYFTCCTDMHGDFGFVKHFGFSFVNVFSLLGHSEVGATRSPSKQLLWILTRLFEWISTTPPPPYEPLEIIRTRATERVIKKMAILHTQSDPPITVISRQMLLLCKKWLPSPLNFFCLISTVVTPSPHPSSPLKK